MVAILNHTTRFTSLCLLRRSPSRDAGLLGKQGCGEHDAAHPWWLCHSSQTDGLRSGKHTCLFPSESEIRHCVYLHELPDSKAQMKTFISIARVFGGKEEEGN